MEQLPLIYRGLIGAVLVFLIMFGVIDLIVRKFFNNSSKRPAEVTTICIIFALGTIVAIVRQTNSVENLPQIDFLITLVNYALGVLWVIGIWQMKKWGAIGYTLTVITSQIFLVFQNQWSVFGILLIFPITVLLYFFSKMH